MPPLPTTLISERISVGTDVSQVQININYTGTILFEISNNSKDVSPTWESIAAISGISITHTFSVVGSDVAFRIIGLPGAIISSNGTTPGIYIKLVF